MDRVLQNKIVSFIWSIAGNYLRDVDVRGKYRDVILRNLEEVTAEILKLE